MPAVSVVIPSYRGGPYLRECVDSVRLQTLEDWEIIIVADGCEDNLTDLESSDSRIRVFGQRKRGASIARNVGIGHARAELIALLDDDDRMLPDRLSAQYAAMEDEQVGWCHSQFRVIDEKGAVIGPGTARETQYGDFLRTDGRVLLSSGMTRKSVIQSVGGFNPLLPIGQDLDLIYRVARESRLHFLPEVLIEYRVHGSNSWCNSSTSSGDEIKMILAQHRLVAQIRQEPENLEAIRIGMKHVLPGRAQFALQRAEDAHQRRDHLEVARAFGQAMAIAPLPVARVLTRAARRQWRQTRSSAQA